MVEGGCVSSPASSVIVGSAVKCAFHTAMNGETNAAFTYDYDSSECVISLTSTTQLCSGPGSKLSYTVDLPSKSDSEDGKLIY